MGMGIALFGGNCVAVRVPGVTRFHSVEDFWAIRADGCPEAGDFVCHSGVDFWAIGADGCPKARDIICHLGVDFWAIGGDGCLKAGDFVCHSGVGFCCPEAGDLGCHSSVDLFFIGADKMSSLGRDLAVAMLSAISLWSIGMSLLVVHIMLSNSKVVGRGRHWRFLEGSSFGRHRGGLKLWEVLWFRMCLSGHR